MSEGQNGPTGAKENESNIATVTHMIAFPDPVSLGLAEKVCASLTSQTLANLQVLQRLPEQGSLTVRIRDFAPRIMVSSNDETESISSKDLYFLEYLTQVAYDAYGRLVQAQLPEDEALDKINFNIDQTVASFSAKPKLYNAFVDYLTGDSPETASNLVAALEQKSGEPVRLLRVPLIARVMREDYEFRPEFRDVLHQSDDSKVQESLAQIFAAPFEQLFSEEVLEDAALNRFKLKYFYPLVVAATLDQPNKFALFNLIEFYKQNTIEEREISHKSSAFASQKGYEFYTGIVEEIIQTALLRDEKEFKQLAFDYVKSQNGSVESQLMHLFGFVTLFEAYGRPHPKLGRWVEDIYPEQSPLKTIVEGGFATLDLQKFVHDAMPVALSEIITAVAEGSMGRDGLEYWAKRCVSYLSSSKEDSRILLQQIYTSPGMPDSVKNLALSKLKSSHS